MQQTNSLQVQQLTYSPNGKTLIEDLSFSVPQGKKVALVGLNGAGKSTLIKLLIGELSTDSGSIRYQSDSPDGLVFKDKLGYQAAAMQALPGVSGQDYLHLVCQTKQRTRNNCEDSINQVSRQWNLMDILAKPMSKLSQGNLQKLVISQAFLGKPDYIFLDEPTQALDPVEQQRFTDNLKELDSIALCLFSSHHITETVQTADLVLLLHQGRLVAQLDLNDDKQCWCVSPLSKDELNADIGEMDLNLVHQGPQLKLFQITTPSEKLTEATTYLGQQDKPLKFLGPAQNALMPLFNMLANGEL